MKPDYKSYSLEELQDALKNLDTESFPDRKREIESEIQLRSTLAEQSSNKVEHKGDFDFNEQFYKCPNCEKRIGFFSKALNKWGKIKICPHCNKPFKFRVSFKAMAIWFIPALLLYLFLLRPIAVSLGLPSSLASGLFGGLFAMLSMRLERVQGGDGT